MANLLFLGPPASGKGTQAKKFSSQYGWPHVSTGDMFREAYAKKTRVGIEAREEFWEKGLLVPDEITNALAFERLMQKDCKKGYILDGYPRTIGQARALEQFLMKNNTQLDHIIYFSCPIGILVERATSRRICVHCSEIYGKELSPKRVGYCDICLGELYRRNDDKEEIVLERLQEYQMKTAPLLEFYRNTEQVKEVDASFDTENVFKQLQEIILS